ncbi:MAG: BMC domain-containing protein [Lacrimispora sp.]|uniref:BMC domain-containing protein n=1 Tax=Lacrimispora sp. TaxID=2719234 RepID=UPI0039E5AAB9
MKQSLGLVEIIGMSTAVLVADVMVKAANVRIIEMENSKGLGYMAIKIQGDVGAVKAAVDAGCQMGRTCGKLAGSKVIPRPSDYVEQIFCSPKDPAPSALPVAEQEVIQFPGDREEGIAEAPEILETPEISGTPEIPGTLEISETPEISEIPEAPETPELLNQIPDGESDEEDVLTEDSEKPVTEVKKQASGTAKKSTRKTSHEKGDH